MERVILGMSGGVDSSVAAILLKEQGYEVVGVTFIFTDNYDTYDAVNVCKNLNIEHHIIDLRKEFKNDVIDKFIFDYSKGFTPNPCVLCNKVAKFKYLYEYMNKYNCNYVATGHYARIIDNKLFKSVDEKKDQTYFLCNIKKEQLKKTLFPLEGITKDRVRKIALENNLINADKKDSTDVCFINSKFNEYIKSKINDKNGPVINIEDKNTVGTHTGLSRYTIGQRRGLNIGGNNERMYVVGKNYDKNILYVAFGDNTDYLISNACLLENSNWLVEDKKINYTAKFRYMSKEIPVEIKWINNEIYVTYESGAKAVTKGQTCAIYDGNMCVGGGTISEIYKNNKKLWYL